MKFKKKKKKKIFFFFRETPLLPGLLLGRNLVPRATILPQSPSSLFPATFNMDAYFNSQ